VARLVVNCSQNGKQLLRLLSARDVSTRYDTMVLLQRIYLRQAAPINAALLADPMALTHLMRVLQESPIDYVRNECLSLLLLLTASESEIQTIVTVQGLVETVFNILEEEDLAAGGKVARDLLRVLCNLLGNATCQRYVREAGGMSSLVAAMAMAISGRPAEDGPEGGPVDEDDVLLAQMADMVPEESRWACLGLLADAALLLAGSQAEATANQQALVRAGALGLCRHVLDGQPGGPPRASQAMALAAKLRLVHLLEALEASPLAARALAAYGEEEPPLLFLLTRAVVGPGVPLGLRSAVGRVLGRTLARHAELQSLVCSSLSPQLEQEPGASAAPAGRQVVEVLEAAAAERPDGVRLWFSLHLLLAMLHGNEAVQTACGSLPVAVPGEEDAGPAETLLALLMRVFPACARACSAAAAVAEADGAPVPGPESVRELGPQSPAAGLLAVMKVLAYWMSRCSAPLQLFASSPVAMPAAIELTTFSEQLGAFFKLQVEGLAGVLMGVCIKAEQGEVDVKSLMAFVARKVGIEEFEQKVERLWRSEALQKPPRGLAEFRWYGGRYREFVRETQQAVKRRMVQLYVAEGVGGGASALSEDVADHYKQLIRVQDSELREVRKENEGLRSEVEAFMRRALQASSAALAEKTAALQEENAALHAELDQLTEEAEVQAQRSRRERDRSNARDGAKGAPPKFRRGTGGTRLPGRDDVDPVDAVIPLQKLGLRQDLRSREHEEMLSLFCLVPKTSKTATMGFQDCKDGQHKEVRLAYQRVFQMEVAPKLVQEIFGCFRAKEAHREDGTAEADVKTGDVLALAILRRAILTAFEEAGGVAGEGPAPKDELARVVERQLHGLQQQK
ncbi:unnamed protein product, partial [Prorocentrum cordatum]